MANSIFGFNFFKQSKSLRTIFVILVFTSSFFAADYFFAHGETLTDSFLSGIQVMSFRNIGNTNPTTSTISGVATPNVQLAITVVDPDANFDLNGIDVVLSSATSTTSGVAKATATLVETGANTGVFTGTITLSSSPTSGSNLEASSNDQYKLFYEPNSEANSVNERHENDSGVTSSFDIGETIYRDNDDSTFVSPGDTRLANAATAGFADGSVVSAVDADIGTNLVLFDDDERHRGFAPRNVFDVGETVYRDNDDNGVVSIGDTRLANAANAGPYVDGSIVAALDFDQFGTLDNFFSPEFSNSGFSLGLPRVQVTVDLNSAGDVTITDDIIDGDEIDNFCFRPVTHIADIAFSNGATQTPGTDLEVVFSYANAIFSPGDDASLLKMYYKEPGQGWEVIRDNFNSQGFSSTAKTITSVPNQAGFVGDVTEGKFVLAFGTGCGGGGGGGLVRPSLVVNALAGLSAISGGGSGPPGPTITLGAVAKSDSGSELISLPQEIREIANNHDPHIPLEPMVDTYEEFDFPLSINGYGFVLGGYENTLQTQTIQPGEPTEFTIVFYTKSEVAHTSLYFNLGPTRTITGSDTQILLYKDQPIEIIDRNGNILSVSGSINNEDDLKRVVTFSITFSKDIQWSKSDLVIRSWNDQLNSGDTIVYDAIQIAPLEEEIAFEQSLPEPEVEQLKSQYIPIWIKNNANWWSQELIEDNDFVAGLEYLIQNDIVTIPESEITINEITTQKIPSWIKNTAGWWSEDQITEKEFIDGIQWLITNGIIKVVET